MASGSWLSHKLDKELAWRKRELISAYISIPKEQNQASKTGSRQGILLLYAHLEGFTKIAFTRYLEAVARICGGTALLKPELIALAFHARLKHAVIQNSMVDLGGCLLEIINSPHLLPPIATNGAIRTRSNLNGDVLRRILRTVALNEKQFVSFETSVINRLVRDRNAIAHGEGYIIEESDYRNLHHAVLDLLDHIREYVEDSLNGAAYLR